MGRPSIELFIPVLIMAILAAILVPNMILARAHGQLTSCKSNMKNIATALEMYREDNAGSLPPSLSPLVPSYLRLVPSCPAAGKDTYSEGYRAQGELFTVFCQGDNHNKCRLAQDYPQFTSQQGLQAGPLGQTRTSFFEIAVEMAGCCLLLFGWGFFFYRASQRPPLMAAAVELTTRNPLLGILGYLSWLVLCVGFTGAAWFQLGSRLGPFLAPILGALAAEAIVRAGWWMWGKLSPGPSAHPVPRESSLWAVVMRTPGQRRLARLCSLAVPSLAILVLGSGETWERCLYGLAAGAMLSFPLYLWARRWAAELFERELELIPGSGLLLEHRQRWGQSVFRQIGTRADVSVETVPNGYCLTIGRCRYLVNATDFVEALR